MKQWVCGFGGGELLRGPPAASSACNCQGYAPIREGHDGTGDLVRQVSGGRDDDTRDVQHNKPGDDHGA